ELARPAEPVRTPPSAGTDPARVGNRHSRSDERRLLTARGLRALHRPAPRTARVPRDTSWQKTLQLGLEVHASAMQSRAHGARLEIERAGDFFVRQAFEVTEHDHDPAFLWQRRDRLPQRRLDLLAFEAAAAVTGGHPPHRPPPAPPATPPPP